MDIRTAINRMKTGIRNCLVSDLWIKKMVPQTIRQRISGRIINALATKTKVPDFYVPGKYPKGINLYGFFKAENGLAQGVKMYARALEEGKIPHTLLNTDFLDWLPQRDVTFDDRLTKENKYAVNVIHVNPDQWQEACGMFPRDQFNGHYNIGIFLWETELVPESWKPMFNYVDEVWTPSEFTARAIRKATDKPVVTIPYCIETPCDNSLTRADFGLREEDFLVLIMYDSNSYSSRKNPVAAINAFMEAFGENPKHVKLVIKISNPKEEDVAFVEEHLGNKDGYTLIKAQMAKQRLNRLIQLCDVFLSLHRSEGFGLVLAEAMNLGTATVATNWSANTEFMPQGTACLVDCSMIPVGDTYEYEQEGAVWAEPDVHQAADYLRRLKEDPVYKREITRAGQQQIREHLSTSGCAVKITNRLDQIIRQ